MAGNPYFLTAGDAQIIFGSWYYQMQFALVISNGTGTSTIVAVSETHPIHPFSRLILFFHIPKKLV